MATAQEVTIVVGQAASTPAADSLTSSGVSTTFTPQLGRDMTVTLSGTWNGSAQLQRSTNGGNSWNKTTIAGGQPWGYFTANCDEVVATPTDKAAIYRLDVLINSGEMFYRIAQ